MNSTDRQSVKVYGPASLSNLGPGFDTLGLCLKGIGDIIEARFTSGQEITITSSAPIPLVASENTAGRAAHLVMTKAADKRGLHLSIKKGIPLGSGIGGSAASASAGAWAANLLLGTPFSKQELAHAVLEAERLASGGTLHGDNALPSLFGGLVLTSPAKPLDYRCIQLATPLHLAVVMPKRSILTADARTILPSAVPRIDAVHNASDLAFMLHAFMTGNWEAVSPYMMRDRVVEPSRASLVPCYHVVREAAMDAGAYGAALTGSGPAMFAIARDSFSVSKVCDAMVRAAGEGARGIVTEADVHGVRQCS
ncbi:MAG: homoserine kinase [Rhodothermaceae bacterium]|nr:homoserine kinase [Rhodothermaceae bacterium]MXX59769.1 homoserine kinase [Rhodothermaceae bacterium]MXZ05461.1 homoserine kinase [Rhodothermaceae bacterium]MYD19492.1 homoserine kinase [Rhodothermaceae bacterium]MYD55619.1 homoserine kinase [Rhodothermaceae bacterium]